MAHTALPVALLALALLAACAGPRSAAAPAAIAFPAQEIAASPLEVELAAKNDEELLAIGTAASAAGDWRRAAAAFDLVADRSPASARAAAALHGAGIAHERLGEWRLALERFRALSRAPGADGVEAAFRIAECQYHLGDLDDAGATLDALAARGGLGAADRARALAQRGVVALDQGRPEDAERSLRAALAAWQEGAVHERLDPYPAAQAEYYLGETYRLAFLGRRLDPSTSDEARLAGDLERKADALLSAQAHYLRAIRYGQPDWSVAAGFRIGELYDTFHEELTTAPLPAGLDAERAAAYRAELAREARVLLAKAIAVYEQTLTVARSTGADHGYVEETQRALERMRRALADAGGPATGAAALPADADPGAGAAPAPAAPR
jgi:hypothetical protein